MFNLVEEEKNIKKIKENNSSQNKNIKISKEQKSEKYINILDKLKPTLIYLKNKRKNKFKNGKKNSDILNISQKPLNIFHYSHLLSPFKKKLCNFKRKSWMIFKLKMLKESLISIIINLKMKQRILEGIEVKLINKEQKIKLKSNPSYQRLLDK